MKVKKPIKIKFEKQPKTFAIDTITYIQRLAQPFLLGITNFTNSTEAEKKSNLSGKHSSSLFFVLDEGIMLPDEFFDKIIECQKGGNMYKLSRYWNRFPYFLIHLGRKMIWDQTRKNADILDKDKFASDYSESIMCDNC